MTGHGYQTTDDVERKAAAGEYAYPRARRGLFIGGIVTGVALVVARLILPQIPFHGTSFNLANSACSGTVGVFARAFGGQSVVHTCGEIAMIFLVANLAAIAGGIVAVLCAVMLWKQAHDS